MGFIFSASLIVPISSQDEQERKRTYACVGFFLMGFDVFLI